MEYDDFRRFEGVSSELFLVGSMAEDTESLSGELDNLLTIFLVMRKQVPHGL